MGDITSSTTVITVVDATGYPTGATGPFWCVIDRGLSTEEKVLATATSGNNITVPGPNRGGDGTVATAHSSGASFEHVLSAEDIREPNAHINTTTLDHHTQYLRTDGTRALTGVSAIKGSPSASAPGDTASDGTGNTLALANHRHAREANTPFVSLMKWSLD